MRPSPQIVAFLAASLLKLKEAGLPDYGAVPRDPEGLMVKAEVYAEVLKPESGEDFPKVIDQACISIAVSRLCRAAPVNGERPTFPTAGEFRKQCEEAWDSVYRHVGVPVLRDGRETLAIAAVQRDASEEEVDRAMERARSSALRSGCKPLPVPNASPPTAETEARMHKMLGWTA